jgi:hypothetical protein
LQDVKKIYEIVIPANGFNILIAIEYELNTIQPKNENYNINYYLRHLFNVATIDKIIPIYDDKGEVMGEDRAFFILRTNLSKLPCIKNIKDITSEFKDSDFSISDVKVVELPIEQQITYDSPKIE